MGQRIKQDSGRNTGQADERRTAPRRDASTIGPVVARLVAGSEVKLLDLSRRGLLLESETRLTIGAKATVKITTTDGALVARGSVVRSRVSGVANGVLTYHTALALEEDLSLFDKAAAAASASASAASAVPMAASGAVSGPALPAVGRAATHDADDDDEDAPDVDRSDDDYEAPYLILGGSERAYSSPAETRADPLAEMVLEMRATVPHDLAELRRRAGVNDW